MHLVCWQVLLFQSTPSARRATRHTRNHTTDNTISIHALREEGDPAAGRGSPTLLHFNPRPPRGGRPTRRAKKESQMFISIHALREEGDTARKTKSINLSQFQSTPSARRATIFSRPKRSQLSNFNPRPPRGGRPAAGFKVTAGAGISIHALREEGDLLHPCRYTVPPYFNPRPPRGGRRLVLGRQRHGKLISIHALREEGDHFNQIPSIQISNFNPRPPRGGRLVVKSWCPRSNFISIHALREEGDEQRLSR